MLTGQLDLLDLIEPEPLPPLPRLVGFTMSVTDPDELDQIAETWNAAMDGRPWNETRLFPGWKTAMWGVNGGPGNHPAFTYMASLVCHHEREMTVGKYAAGYCQCVGRQDGNLYRIYCSGCDWWTPVSHGENEAVEKHLDHCWPGWQAIPLLPKTGKLPKDYPTEWQEPGAPIRTLRTGAGTRHVPGRSPFGGYDIGVPSQSERRSHDTNP